MTLRFRPLILIGCVVAVGCNWLVGVHDLPISEDAGREAGEVDATEASDDSSPDVTSTDSNVAMSADAGGGDDGSPVAVEDATEGDSTFGDADASTAESGARDARSDANGTGDSNPPTGEAGTHLDAAPDAGVSAPLDAGDAAGPADATAVPDGSLSDVGLPDVGLPDVGLPDVGSPGVDP